MINKETEQALKMFVDITCDSMISNMLKNGIGLDTALDVLTGVATDLKKKEEEICNSESRTLC